MTIRKTDRQRQEWACQQAHLREAEKRLEKLHDNNQDLSADAWLQERIGLQRKLNRVRAAVKLPAVNWVQTNAADRALQRRTAAPPS